jgi:hypothetical protein
MGKLEAMLERKALQQERRMERAYAKLRAGSTAFKPSAAGTAVLGAKQLDRKLARLSRRSGKKAVTAGVRASLTPVARAMRAAINASDASPSLKQGARQSIGQRFSKTRRTGVREAKVGFAVNKRGAKRTARLSKGASGGVGISSRNIHWFVLGTDERFLKSGRPTGRVDGVFGNVTHQAFLSAHPAALEAARVKIEQIIKREARKKG